VGLCPTRFFTRPRLADYSPFLSFNIKILLIMLIMSILFMLNIHCPQNTQRDAELFFQDFRKLNVPYVFPGEEEAIHIGPESCGYAGNNHTDSPNFYFV
jgi:hypothetical protein